MATSRHHADSSRHSRSACQDKFMPNETPVTDNAQAPQATPVTDVANDNVPRPPLTPAAQRALKEAEERRQAATGHAKASATEIGGRAGPDPVRYGDWESGGIAWDF
jgi:hypothetical protein